ncbi:MAG: repair protein RecO [Pseudomonadota bacterium]|jgi:DNA repair protein RecO (recombination protein O)
MRPVKVERQPAFVLHSRPYRETSLIVEAITRDYGRMALVAKGVRRPRSAMRGVLMAFQPLEMTWSGKGEVVTLHNAEWQGGQPLLQGRALLCAYYLNELLMNLLPREDAHEQLFTHYSSTLQALSTSESHDAAYFSGVLRRFEKQLLGELGYGLMLLHDASGQPIVPADRYLYEMESGPRIIADSSASAGTISGQTLLDMEAESFDNPVSLLESKQLMRSLMAFYLNGRQLHSRRLFEDLADL